MVNRPFSVFMVLLLFAAIPTAFAEDGRGTEVEDEAGPAGTGAGNLGNGAEEILDDGDSAGFDGEIFPPRNEDAGAAGEANGNEESRGEEEPGDGKDDGEKAVPGLIVSAGIGYTIVDGERDYTVSIDALLPYEKSADGKFEILLDGRKPVEWDWEDGAGGLNASASFKVDKPGTYEAFVRFKGNVDGREVVLEAGKTVRFPGRNYRLEVTYDGKRTFGGKLSGVKEAKGTWFIGVYDHRREDRLLEEHCSDSFSSLAHAHTFKKLKPGTYDVLVTFGGVADGIEVGATGILRGVEIKGDGTGKIRVSDQFPSKAADDPGKGEKIIGGAKGGALPKTGTPYPFFLLSGWLMLSAGLVLMIRRIRRT